MPYERFKKEGKEDKYCLRNKETGEERCFSKKEDREVWAWYVMNVVDKEDKD